MKLFLYVYGNSKQILHIVGFFCETFQFLLSFVSKYEVALFIYKLEMGLKFSRKMKCKVSGKFMFVYDFYVWNIRQ